MFENWLKHRFQNSPFSSVHTKTKHFKKSPLSKAFSKVSVFGGNDSTHSSFTCGRGLNIMTLLPAQVSTH